MAVVEQYRAGLAALDPAWQEAHFVLTVPAEGERRVAASILGPTGPGLHGDAIRFSVSRTGSGSSPDNVDRLLARVEAEGVTGTLALHDATVGDHVDLGDPHPLAGAWDAELETLPGDWSDVLVELALTSSDHVDPAALLLGPLNPAAERDRPVMRFRAARVAGFGASPAMVRRCLERLDEQGIDGTVRVVTALSGSDGGFTQGPTWIVAGRNV